MRGAVLYGPRDIRSVEREEPKIVAPTDVILLLSATCVCGSTRGGTHQACVRELETGQEQGHAQ